MTKKSLPLANTPHWQPSLSGDGVVTALADIEQSIHIILATLFGTVPHRPDFACNCIELIDRDYDDAAPIFIQRATDAILSFEPRVESLTITAVGGQTESSLAQATFRISWQPVDNLLPQSFEYRVTAA